MSKYGVISGPYFPAFGLNTGKYGPEITPYLDTFHAVSSFAIAAHFCLFGTTEKTVSKIMQDIESSKAAGVDKFLGRFLTDGGHILAKPVFVLCKLLISGGVFPNACKVAKRKPILKNFKKRCH